MGKQTVFRKVSVKDRLPSEELFTVLTDKGRLFTFDVKICAKWWLEEIELPSEEEVTTNVLYHNNTMYHDNNMQEACNSGISMCYNYILNKLK